MADNNSLLAAALMQQNRRRDEPADRSRRFAQLLMQQGASTEPVKSPLEGLARALTGGLGGFFEGQDERRQDARDKSTLGALSKAATAGTLPEQQEALRGIQGDPSVLGPVLASMVGQRQQQLQAGQHADAFTAGFGKVTNPPAAGAPPTAVAQGGDAPLPGIPAFESGGRYDAVGPVANQQGDRAYGKYQVMGANIPVWTKEVLGQEMTPEQFVASPQAQDAVYKAKIGQYRQQTGSDQGAASMWFSGQPNPQSTARDVNGVNVQQYVQRTTGGAPMAQGDAPVAQPRADASGTPAPPSSTVPDVPRPQPSPQQVEKYTGMIRDGSMTAAQARTALDQELTQEWTVQRENRRMQWQQEQEDQRVKKKAAIDLEQKAPMELITKRMDAYEKEQRPRAEAAVQEIGSIHQVRQLLDAGAFTGMGAEAQAAGSRLAQALGIDWGADMQANTAALQSAVGNRVLALVKNLGSGTGISNADREYASKIAGGEISVGEPAMRRILEIGERAARTTLKTHEAETARLRKVPGVAQLGDEYFQVPPAPTYDEWSKANPLPKPQGAAPAAGAPQQPQAAPRVPAEGSTATNPQTGQKIRMQGGQWVPVQ